MYYGSKYDSGVNIPFFLFPLFLICCCVGFVLYEINRKEIPCDVYFINGTDEYYTISVNGTALKLPPKEPKMLSLKEGDIIVKSPFGEIKQTIKTENFKRQSAWKNVYLFNPDANAILAEVKVSYTPKSFEKRNGNNNNNNNKGKEDEVEYHTGEQYYLFKYVDYVFVEPPANIHVVVSNRDHNTGTWKKWLTILKDDEEEIVEEKKEEAADDKNVIDRGRQR